MEFREIERPTKAWRGKAPEADPDLVAALLRTVDTGLAIELTTAQMGKGGGGPAQGYLYRLGYNVNQTATGPDTWGVYVKRGLLGCPRCGGVVDMVGRLAAGLPRLRTRDDCPRNDGGRLRLMPRDKDTNA